MHYILMEVEKNEGSYRKYMAFGQRKYIHTKFGYHPEFEVYQHHWFGYNRVRRNHEGTIKVKLRRAADMKSIKENDKYKYGGEQNAE